MSPTKITAVVLLVSVMLNAGLQADRTRLVAALKNTGLMARALLANVVIVPLLGVLLVRLFALPPLIAVGFLLMALAPGAPFLPRAAGRQPGGSLGFAIALAFILPAVSVVTIPLTAPLVFPARGAGHVPIVPVMINLIVIQLLPLLIGLLIADRAPQAAAKLNRPLTVVFALAVVVLLVLNGATIPSQVAAVYGSRGMLAMLVISLLSVATGWLLAFSDLQYRRTLGISTALRNVGLCLTVATANFPGTIVAATVFTYLLIQFVVTFAFRLAMHRIAGSAKAQG